MLEFLKNDVVEKVFTFSVPPESENFDFPQRVTETPTFGGVVFDDYGNDTVKIRLAGSTINEEKKLIYRGNAKPPSYLTGEKEIFELQEIFEEWGKLENIPGKKVYLYDLSKMNLLQIGMGSPPARNYWRVASKGLKIKRAKDKPFTYNYELELIGIVDEPRTLPPLFDGKLGALLDKCAEIAGALEKLTEAMEEIAFTADMYTQAIVDVRKFFEQMQNGSLLANTEAVLRKFPGGNNLWSLTKTLVSWGSKMTYIFGTSASQTVWQQANYSKHDVSTVSFNSGGGSYVSPVRVSYGDFAEKPADPILAKFEFLGWYTDPAQGELFEFDTAEITKNIILYAKWEQIQATIAYNSRQGSAVQPQTVNIGATAEAPETPPARQGYVFEYWCADMAAQNRYDFSAPVTADITLYARWKVTHTVTFSSNDGSPVNSQSIDTGGKVIYPPVPAKENYLFGMWCTDPQLTAEYDFNSAVTGSFTLHAKWARVSNNVAFDSNGGSEIPEQIVAIGGLAVKPDDPAREGYSFVRWCIDPGLTQEFLFASTPVNYPATLYAAWAIVSLSVEFDSDGGSAVASQSVDYGKLAVYPVTPVKQGCLFARWLVIEEIEIEDTENGEGGEEVSGETEEVMTEEVMVEYDFSAPVVKNLTLYAEWHAGTA